MGIYLNPGNRDFAKALNSQIYVDKTKLIKYTNDAIGTRQQFMCVSRPRRFGKTMAAEMLAAYYSKGCSSAGLFDNLYISTENDFTEHLNKHNVIMLNMQQLLSSSGREIGRMTEYASKRIIRELNSTFPELSIAYDELLPDALNDVYTAFNEAGFVFIIDEWDCVFREKRDDPDAQMEYLDFLRNLLKDRSYVDLVYMTGILPIKKYGTHSALNLFDEYSMIDMGELSELAGFTEDEVRQLCEKYGRDFGETKLWYDGYYLDGIHIYNPKSVIDSIRRKKFGSYWTRTETYEALKIYLDMNFDSLKESIISMIGGNRCKINPLKFSNDMTTFLSEDDVMTLLVHLGYLGYDSFTSEVFIPNEEIRGEFINATDGEGWNELAKAINSSEDILKAIWNGDAAAVAVGIENVHEDTSSILTYNNENALSCTISLALYTARAYYGIVRELPTGKGFADIAFIPRRHVNKPAIIVELKRNSSADAAIAQIKRKNYTKALSDYSGEIILVGISYDKDKKHSCVIEKVTK